MKKFFAALFVFIMAFSACDTGTSPNSGGDDNNGNDNSDIIGTWTGSYEGHNTRLEIAEGSYIFVTSGETINGTWIRNGNTITATSDSSIYIDSIKAILTSSGSMLLTFTIQTEGSAIPESVSFELTRTGGGAGGEDDGTGSGAGGEDDGTGSEDGFTPLTIDNQSGYPLSNVSYSSIYFFNTIQAGQSVTKNVSAGTKNLLFEFDIERTIVGCRLAEIITVEEETPKTVTIQNNTIIVVVKDEKQGGLKAIYDELVAGTKSSSITMKYGEKAVAQQETIELGSVRINTNKDFSFTIGNSGTADLTIESIDGNRINLSDNASGYFSVQEQPFEGIAVAPQNTADFTIRFSPQAASGTVTADIRIKTNSAENGDFVFRVRASGTDTYQIGDTGPGDGIIFFAQGGQYKECSVDLGVNSWTNADTTAKAFRGGGYIDWSLPDRAELDLVYQNIYKKGLEESFLNDDYWSSQLNYDTYYFYQDFFTGSQYSKFSSCRFFAVRSF